MNNVLKTTTVAAAMALTLAFVAPADAGIISVTSSVGGAATGASVVYENFNTLTPGSAVATLLAGSGIGVSFTGDAQAVSGNGSGYAAPYLSGLNGQGFGNAAGQDTTPFLTTGIGSVTLTMPTIEKYFGILWGSIDGYNTLTFKNGSTVVGTLTGAQVSALANGDQGVNGTSYVNVLFDDGFNTVIATSSSYAFEFDNVAISQTNPVPEPASMVLLGTGLIGLGRAWRKRRS